MSFEKLAHLVDLGLSCNSDSAGKEIVFYISKSIVVIEITKPLNSNAINYYSVLNDGTTVLKLYMKKKFISKTGATGTPRL